jgi:hypothetical protein
MVSVVEVDTVRTGNRFSWYCPTISPLTLIRSIRMIDVKRLETIADDVVRVTYSHGIVGVRFSVNKVNYSCQYDSRDTGLYGFEVWNPEQLFFPELEPDVLRVREM